MSRVATMYGRRPVARGLPSVLLLLLLLVQLSCTGTEPGSQDELPGSFADHVVMISIDGLIPDYYTRPEELGMNMPHLSRLAALGAHAGGVEGVYPSITYPSHTTLVTGMLPAKHGIVQNRIFQAPTEPQTRPWYWFAEMIRGETLWTAAEDAGLVTAAVGWPVTAGARIDFNVPEIWSPTERGNKQLYELSTPGLFEEAFGAVEGHGIGTDEDRTGLAESIVKRHRPNLVLVHLVELDTAQHHFGPRSPEAIAEAERQDAYVGRILDAAHEAGIFDRTAFVIVSDHGFAGIDQTFEPNVLLARNRLITLNEAGTPEDWRAASWPAGGSCAIVLRDSYDTQTMAKVRDIFAAVLDRPDSPIRKILDRETLDRLGAIPQAALMLEAADGYAFGESWTGPEIHSSGADYRGTHGYLPTRPKMRAAFLAFGPGVRARTREDLVRMIDIAPTVASLLRLRLPQADGQPMWGIVRPPLLHAMGVDSDLWQLTPDGRPWLNQR